MFRARGRRSYACEGDLLRISRGIGPRRPQRAGRCRRGAQRLHGRRGRAGGGAAGAAAVGGRPGGAGEAGTATFGSLPLHRQRALSRKRAFDEGGLRRLFLALVRRRGHQAPLQGHSKSSSDHGRGQLRCVIALLPSQPRLLRFLCQPLLDLVNDLRRRLLAPDRHLPEALAAPAVRGSEDPLLEVDRDGTQGIGQKHVASLPEGRLPSQVQAGGAHDKEVEGDLAAEELALRLVPEILAGDVRLDDSLKVHKRVHQTLKSLRELDKIGRVEARHRQLVKVHALGVERWNRASLVKVVKLPQLDRVDVVDSRTGHLGLDQQKERLRELDPVQGAEPQKDPEVVVPSNFLLAATEVQQPRQKLQHPLATVLDQAPHALGLDPCRVHDDDLLILRLLEEVKDVVDLKEMPFVELERLQ
mmetsp:Transcript_69075/g.225200  ORF Transcript_69075/g.225200 Transcript_69075/m.225200 type:complete len:416 (+) Transcript_69075:313-1560(+)